MGHSVFIQFLLFVGPPLCACPVLLCYFCVNLVIDVRNRIVLRVYQFDGINQPLLSDQYASQKN